MIKKLINRWKARKEHKERMQEPYYWNMRFNETLKTIQHENKQKLLKQLMEVTNTSPDDNDFIEYLDALIEKNKRKGIVTELYTKLEDYNNG